MALFIVQLPVGGYDDNLSYLIVDNLTRETLVVDPCGDWNIIKEPIDSQSLKVTGILLTHTHHDHIDALAEATTTYAVPVYVHRLGAAAVRPAPISEIDDHSSIELSTHRIFVRHTPGHSDDSVCFYIEAKDALQGTPQLITGDTLFVHGCGRTTEQKVKDLYESLQELKAFPDETTIYPGHNYGPTTTSTIGEEKAHNRFMLAPNFTDFSRERLG